MSFVGVVADLLLDTSVWTNVQKSSVLTSTTPTVGPRAMRFRVSGAADLDGGPEP